MHLLRGALCEQCAAYMKLNAMMNEWVQPISKTKHSKLKEAPQRRSHAHLWNQPTDSRWQLADDMDVHCSESEDQVEKHGDDAVEQSFAVENKVCPIDR